MTIMQPHYPIHTDRLVLRPFRRGDVDAVFSYRNRQDVAAYLSDGPMSRQTCVEAIDRWAGQVAWLMEGDKVALAIVSSSTNALMGEISLIWRAGAVRQGEVGYILHPHYHGCGYATEAARAMLDLAFGALGLHQVMARCHADNISSYRLMERLGMRRRTTFCSPALQGDQSARGFVYAIERDDWICQSKQDVKVSGESVFLLTVQRLARNL